MSLWSTLPPDEQLLIEPADEADLALAGEQDERADLAAYRRARRRARTRRLGTGALGLTVLALLWQLIAMLINDPVFLPSVSQTVASFAHYFGRPYPSQGKPLWFDALTSLRRILIGVAPIMAVTTVAALDEVPEDLRLCARTLGASPRYTMLRVQIRAALPGILTGMRIAMAGAWTSIVAAELIAATSGLGYLIMQAGDYLNTALVFSGIIMIAIIALVLDACLRGLLLLADPSRRR